MERKHIRLMFQGRLPRDDKGRKQTTEGNARGHIGKTLYAWPRFPVSSSSIVHLCSNLALAVSCVGMAWYQTNFTVVSLLKSAVGLSVSPI